MQLLAYLWRKVSMECSLVELKELSNNVRSGLIMQTV